MDGQIDGLISHVTISFLVTAALTEAELARSSKQNIKKTNRKDSLWTCYEKTPGS